MSVHVHQFRSLLQDSIRFAAACALAAALGGCGVGSVEGPSSAEIKDALREHALGRAAEHVKLVDVRRASMRPGPAPGTVTGSFTARLRLTEPVRRVVDVFGDAVVARTALKSGETATIHGRLLATKRGGDWIIEGLSAESSDLVVTVLDATKDGGDELHVGDDAFGDRRVLEMDSDAHQTLIQERLEQQIERARNIQLMRPPTLANVRSRAQQVFESTRSQRRSLFDAIVEPDGLRFVHRNRSGRHLILRIQESDGQALTFSGTGVDFTEMPPRRFPFSGFVTNTTDDEPIALLEGAFANGLTQVGFNWVNKDGALGFGRTDRRLAPLTAAESQRMRQRANRMDAAYRAIQYTEITARLYTAEERKRALRQMPRLVTPAVYPEASQNLAGRMFDGDYDSDDRPEGSGQWMSVQLQPVLAHGVALLFEDEPDHEDNGFLMGINGGAPMPMRQPEEEDGLLVVRFDQPQELHQIRINTQDRDSSSFVLRELTVIPPQ